MSRSVQPKAAKAKAPPVTPAATHDIIPGRLNEHDWNQQLDRDGGNEFIMDIVEELCSSALDTIYGNYIERQLVPYTVCQAKDAILQIVEWQFLARDNGEQTSVTTEPLEPVEVGTEAGWTEGRKSVAAGWAEDEEPEPAVTDCWAQGSVPRKQVRRPTVLEEEDEEPLPVEDELQEGNGENQEEVSPETRPEVAEDADFQASREPTCTDPEEYEGGSEPLEESVRGDDGDDRQETFVDSEVTVQPEPPSEPKKTARRKFKPYTGRMKSAGVSKMTESLDDTEMKLYQEATQASYKPPVDRAENGLMPASCHSMIKLQAGRPPVNRDVMFDDSGNVVAINKLDPEKLPNHKVKTGYKIVDPAAEAAQARIKAMRTGKYQANSKDARCAKNADAAYTSSTHTMATSINSKHMTVKQSKPYDVVPLPPPLIDTVKLVPGVVIRQGNQVKKGPRPKGKKAAVAVYTANEADLMAVCLRPSAPTVTVAEILEHQTPVVKPMAANLPIPPIAQGVQS